MCYFTAYNVDFMWIILYGVSSFFTINENFLLAVIDDQYSISSPSFSICLVHCKYVRILCIFSFFFTNYLNRTGIVLCDIFYFILCVTFVLCFESCLYFVRTDEIKLIYIYENKTSTYVYTQSIMNIQNSVMSIQNIRPL